MRINCYRPPLGIRPTPASPPRTAAKQLETTPIPREAGVAGVDPLQGSLAYQGPLRLRARLEAAAVELIGLRHGQSEANAEGQTGIPTLCGQSETPLTGKGREQAVQAAERLYQQFGGDDWVRRASQDPNQLPLVYCSPLSRASDTAQALVDLVHQRSQALGCPLELPVTPEPRLLEIALGAYEMKPASKLMRDHPTFAANFDAHRGAGIDFQHRFPQGESRLDVMGRVSSLLDEIVEKGAGRRVLLVCHQETLVAARTALGLSKQRDGRIRADSSEIQNATPLPLVTPNQLNFRPRLHSLDHESSTLPGGAFFPAHRQSCDRDHSRPGR